MRKVTFFLTATVLLGAASLATGLEGPKIGNMNTPSGQRVNKHNLSGLSTRIAPDVTYKATYDAADRRTTEVCIFCHTPHNASPSTALWGRQQTVTNSFGHYTAPNLQIQKDSSASTASEYGEPNYSSRLCLSCHDGATALGAVLNGPEIVFDAAVAKILPRTGEYNVFNPSSVITTEDATQHHHPISFKYNDTVKSRILAIEGKTYKYPWEGPSFQFTDYVKLDRRGFMQCTTCHNPHQNMSDADSGSPDTNVDTPFWVITNAQAAPSGKNVHDNVCLSCHPLLEFSDPIATAPKPYQYP